MDTCERDRRRRAAEWRETVVSPRYSVGGSHGPGSPDEATACSSEKAIRGWPNGEKGLASEIERLRYQDSRRPSEAECSGERSGHFYWPGFHMSGIYLAGPQVKASGGEHAGVAIGNTGRVSHT